MKKMSEDSENKISLKEWIRGEFSYLKSSITELTKEVRETNKTFSQKFDDQEKRMDELDKKIDTKFSATMFVQTVLTTVITVVGGVYLKFFGGNTQ